MSKGNEEYQPHKFNVVEVPGPAILGLPSCKDLMVIALDPDSTTYKHDLPSSVQYGELRATHLSKCVTFNNISDEKLCFPECFDTIGEFKREAKLHITPDSTPYIDAPRRTSVHILPKVKTQLNMMVSDGIIRKEDHHTDWCSSATYVRKKDGTINICFDPQKLNLALKRCPYKIPTVEEINPELSKAKFFSKLDAKAGYWSICLPKKLDRTYYFPYTLW